MLTDYFEPFLLLEGTPEPDGTGGTTASDRLGTDFRGALTQTAGSALDAGGRSTLRLTPVLLHEMDVTLLPGDRVKRLGDGSIWRVTGASGDMRSPAFSGLQFAQVPAERVVIPC